MNCDVTGGSCVELPRAQSPATWRRGGFDKESQIYNKGDRMRTTEYGIQGTLTFYVYASNELRQLFVSRGLPFVSSKIPNQLKSLLSANERN